MTEPSTGDELERVRRRTLGWQLGYGFGLLNHIVVGRVRERGHPSFKLSHSTLTRAMSVDGERLTNLATRAGVTKQAMSQLAGEMARLGYVAIRPDPRDGRAKLVVYRAKGRDLAATIVAVAQEIEQACFARLGAARSRSLRDSLDVVTQVLEQLLGEADRA